MKTNLILIKRKLLSKFQNLHFKSFIFEISKQKIFTDIGVLLKYNKHNKQKHFFRFGSSMTRKNRGPELQKLLFQKYIY